MKKIAPTTHPAGARTRARTHAQAQAQARAGASLGTGLAGLAWLAAGLLCLPSVRAQTLAPLQSHAQGQAQAQAHAQTLVPTQPAPQAQALGQAAAPAPDAQPTASQPVDASLAQQLQRMAGESASSAMGSGMPMRVEVELGQLDPRLKLAPCEQIQPYLPTGVRPYGRTRIGLRCLQGPTRWNVYLPVTVKLFAPAMVAASALPAGTLLEAQHLQRVEVDLAASPDPAITTALPALGRTLARPLAAGDTLRRNDLKARQYFSAGDVVRIVAVGAGYSVSAEGQAVTPGIEGQPARVKVESGRILSGLPSGDRRMEIAL